MTRWTPAEHETLDRLYATAPKADVLAALLGRNWGALCQVAHDRGLLRRVRKWSKADLERLAELFPVAPKAEILAAFPGASWGSITAKAWKHNIRRSRLLRCKPPPAMDGVFLALRMARAHQNISRNDLAARLGCHPVHLSRCELGRHVPSLAFLRRWADALGYRFELVYGRASAPRAAPDVSRYAQPLPRYRKALGDALASFTGHKSNSVPVPVDVQDRLEAAD